MYLPLSLSVTTEGFLVSRDLLALCYKPLFYLNTWVALLLSLQQQNPNTIFSALTSKRLELITLEKDKIPSYCSFSLLKLIQVLL